MCDIADYETDILLWSERQAALLRDLKTRAQSLPNELDLENVAEEIESVGRSEQRAFESYVKQVFIHLLKMTANSDLELRLRWAEEIDNFKSQAERAVTPSMLQRLDVDSIWRHAIVNARTMLRRRGEALPGEPPKQSPFSLGDILDSDDIDADALASRITFTP